MIAIAAAAAAPVTTTITTTALENSNGNERQGIIRIMLTAVFVHRYAVLMQIMVLLAMVVVQENGSNSLTCNPISTNKDANKKVVMSSRV